MSGPILDLNGLLEETAEAASERFGIADVDRVLGEDRWMVFVGRGWSLRLRARPKRNGGPARVRSWTVTFDPGLPSLEAACSALALPPPAPTIGRGPIRLRLPTVRSGRSHSLTAVERDGLIRSVTAFDEPPDWGGETETT